ncbi:hypothetical protein FQR65_LT11150 [Abscondita terminalis]|nr:hypothetical protein FQR65_LT11150 [Abscondita terminalis]
MLDWKLFLIFLSIACSIQAHHVDKRFWFGKKKSTTLIHTTTIAATTPIPTTEIPNLVDSITFTGNITPVFFKGFPPSNYFTNATTETPVNPTTVVQDALVKTVDNVMDLPQNLVDVKSGNPLNIVKTVVKTLPVVNESRVDKGFDTLQKQIVNLPNSSKFTNEFSINDQQISVTEGAKKGVEFVNSSISFTKDALGNVINPLKDVVSSSIDQGANLLNATGGVLGRVLDPVAFLGVGVVNGTGNIVGGVTDSVGSIFSDLINFLGLPLFISELKHLQVITTAYFNREYVLVLSIIVLGIIIAILCLVICAIRRCVISKKTKSYIHLHTPGKNSKAEDAQSLLP